MHEAPHVPFDRRLYQVSTSISLITGLVIMRRQGAARRVHVATFVHLIMAIVTTCQIADPLWYVPPLHPSSVV